MEGTRTSDFPQDFGPYRLRRHLASGGMSEILLAYHRDSPLKPLVIKRILPKLARDSASVVSFLKEARLTAKLSHPNIVRVVEVGELEGEPFMVMEYLQGHDLRTVFNKAFQSRRSLPLANSIQIVAWVARGLACVHRAADAAGRPLALVHRDVSPQNILVTYQGQVKIIDFGLTQSGLSVSTTNPPSLRGTCSYLSPEEALGEPIDHRSDLFALGIILYEVTTGYRLFRRGSELGSLQAIINGDVRPPSESWADYPQDLERSVLTALRTDPRERHQDGEVWANDLEQMLRRRGWPFGPKPIARCLRVLFGSTSFGGPNRL